MRKLVSILVVMVASMLSGALNAQNYKFEIGAGVGMSGYLGDVNKSNFLKHPGFAGGAMFRYVLDYRWSLKANLFTAGLSGNSADYGDVFPGGATYKFNSQIYDLGAQMEFNFFNYGIGYTYKRLHRLTPYMLLGLGGTLSSCGGHTAFAINIPMGVGLKYKLKERLNLGFEFTMRKTFGDKIDNFTIDDLNGIKSSFVKNTDWYSLILFSITYEFGKKCEQCHYVE
ncbi:MAG: DUF6089 family protein [Muribaculaceae bacterium]|nr:DUF6089 family protein [Muribaculaceae bacterium]